MSDGGALASSSSNITAANDTSVTSSSPTESATTTTNTFLPAPKSHVPVAAIVAPTVTGVTILIIIVLGGFWIMQRRRRRREVWHSQRPIKPPTGLGEPKSRCLDADEPGGAGARITVTLTEAKVSDPDLVVIDRSYLAAPTDNASVSSTATTNRSYDLETTSETETGIPFFQRLKLLRRAGEMPRRKSVVLDQYTLQQLNNGHAKVEVVEVGVTRHTYVFGEQMKRSLEVESGDIIDGGVTGDRMELRETPS